MEHTCYTCGTDNFEAGAFSDITTDPAVYADAENLYCLGCAAKYDEDGTAEFVMIPTVDQLATAHEWSMAGIGIN